MAGWALETQDRKIKWPEWSAEIVEKFLEWLYTGDYTIPYPKEVVRPDEHDSDVQFHEPAEDEVHEEGMAPEGFPVEHQEQEWSIPLEAEPAPQPELPQPLTSCTELKRTAPMTPLKDLTWEGCHAVEKTSHAEDFDLWIMCNQDDNVYPFDYEETLMTHATLYVIACQKDLAELKNMAWQRLRVLLVKLGAPDAGRPMMGNMVALIRYAYQETGVSELPVDPLRHLITSYVALHFTKFKGPEVDSLFASQAADDRDFVVEVVAKVRQRVEDLEATKSTPVSPDIVDSPWASKKGKKKGRWPDY